MKTLESKRQVKCWNCEQEFRQEFGAQYCSDDCRKAKWNKHTSSRRRAATAAMLVVKACGECGNEFSFVPLRGKTSRKYCSKKCCAAASMRNFKERNARLETCRVDGCDGKANRTGQGLCELHYMRKRRHGSTGKLRARDRKHNYQGYVFLRNATHPMSRSDGLVAEHRMVVYDKHHGTCPPCHWCGESLEWPDAVADHLNERKDDNRIDNVVVSCNGCNRARGAMLPFLAAMQPSAHALFLTLVSQQLGMHHDKRTAKGE